jgi:hypothetical protein
MSAPPTSVSFSRILAHLFIGVLFLAEIVLALDAASGSLGAVLRRVSTLGTVFFALPTAMLLGHVVDRLGHIVFDRFLIRKMMARPELLMDREFQGYSFSLRLATETEACAKRIILRGPRVGDYLCHMCDTLPVHLFTFINEEWAHFEFQRNGSLVCAFFSVIFLFYAPTGLGISLSTSALVSVVSAGCALLLAQGAARALRSYYRFQVRYLIGRCIDQKSLSLVKVESPDGK